jgi:O-methyltransferase
VKLTPRRVLASLNYRARRRILAARTALFGAPPQRLDVAAEVAKTEHRSVFWGDRMMTLDKIAGFLDDPCFKAAFQAIKGKHIYDQYDSPHTISWRLHTQVWAAEHALKLEGDFVECGVFKGDMAWVVVTMMGERLRDRTFYLYDSFEGLSPEQIAQNADYAHSPGFVGTAKKAYEEEGIEASVRARFAPFPNVKITKGFLPGTLDQACPDKIAYLHMDLNSALAEVATLERLFDRVVPGGIVVFDDYGWDLFRIQRAAEDEFFAKRGYVPLELPTGQGLVVKR